MLKRFILIIARHPLSLLGATLATACSLVILTLFGVDLIGISGGPYRGILAYVILPALFVLGLGLIPVGTLAAYRRDRRHPQRAADRPRFPVIDLNREQTRRALLLFAGLSCANIVILALATYKSAEVMDSNEFCGGACHSVMSPWSVVYQRSPHSSVECVHCHIGPGADAVLKAKLSGARQLLQMVTGRYSRPIPSPPEGMRSARDTCGHCHTRGAFTEDRLKIITHHAEDEANTALHTLLMLHIGGFRRGMTVGIHWHIAPGVRIWYRSDPKRETIRDVEVTRADGTVKTFVPSGGSGSPAEGAEDLRWREMDCIDCHNRLGHLYRSPDREIDEALEDGRISTSIPWIRREGLKALRTEYSSHLEARAGIARALLTEYERNYSEVLTNNREAVETAARELGEIWCRNVFPAMNITWGTYPSHQGHTDAPGCFRCHDEEHSTAEGETISQDCSLCHALVANEEKDPEALRQLRP